MRSAVVALLVAAAYVFPAAQALAKEEFYIELGHEVGEEEAIASWQALSKKHQNLLKGLKFMPQAVLRRDGDVYTRVQAGPLEAKNDALKLCAKLFAKDTPCFVIEGLAPPSPTQVRSLMHNDTAGRKPFLPWLMPETQPSVVMRTDPAQETSVVVAEPVSEFERTAKPVPIVFDAPPPVEEKPVAAEEGKVKVAEAIRVPLTDATDMQPPVPDLKPQVDMGASPVAMQNTLPVPPEEVVRKPILLNSMSRPGWLNAEHFLTEGMAADLWQRVMDNDPAGTSGLRIRLVQPAVDNGRPSVSLGIGPFADREEAMAFCLNNIKPVMNSLRCRFAYDEPVRRRSTVMAAPYQHGDAYSERRRSLMAARRAATASAAPEPAMASAPVSNEYWIQVASTTNRPEAMDVWDSLREKHPDLMEGVRSGVFAVAGGRAGYAVRVGPFREQAQALGLHKALKDRGIGGEIFSNP